MKFLTCCRALVLFLLVSSDVNAAPIENELIDARGFAEDVEKALELRRVRTISEDEFLRMAEDKNTLILDARTAFRFNQLHIAGAKNLPFTEFTERTLTEAIPSKDTRILIYCNNNMKNSPEAFATKAYRASLNLSTYPALYTYGYRNVFELGPVIDPATSKIQFSGSVAGR